MANANNNKGVDIAKLLAIANTQTSTRKANSAKLYTDGKLNIAVGSGVDSGKRYTAKIANNTLLLYSDANGKRKANNKGVDGVIVGITAKLAKQTAYQNAVKYGKMGDSCKDYTIQHQTLDGVDYMIIDLLEYSDGKK